MKDDAFDAFFVRYYSMLCAYAQHWVGAADAEEIVQDVMVWFWENKDTHHFDVSMVGYFFKTVKNRSLNQLYKRRHQQMASDFFLQNSLENDIDYVVVEQLTTQITKAVDQLPDNIKEAFVMNRFHGMTYAQIAKKKQVSTQTIAYRISQALSILRIKLKDYLDK